MLTPQSEELTVEAPALPASSVILKLSQDQINHAYKTYLQQWERYEKWIKRNSKTYNIMQRYIKNNYKLILKVKEALKYK